MEFRSTEISNGKDGEKSYARRSLLFMKNKRKKCLKRQIDYRRFPWERTDNWALILDVDDEIYR